MSAQVAFYTRLICGESNLVRSTAERQNSSMSLDYTRFVVGYHGCDAAVAKKVLLGEDQLKPSRNPYDWLAQEIYFWEHGPARAMQFASNEAARKSSKIKTPDVIGAYIHLGNCFDLLDVAYTSVLEAESPGRASLGVAFGETASGASSPDARAARLAPVRSAPGRRGSSGWRTLTASGAGWLGDWPCGRRDGRSSAGDRPSAAQG